MYKGITDLPDPVKQNLPKRVQKIYLVAYNHAWKECTDGPTRQGDASREEAACRAAWGAVELEYVRWVARLIA